ncbi:MAG: KH domain-containing protein [Candidatus Uhrbacteria bacterium]
MKTVELVKHMVQAMVDHPDEVKVDEIMGQHSCVLELTVNQTDIGKVIGKRGVHAQALRTLIVAFGGKEKKRYVLEILEDRS